MRMLWDFHPFPQTPCSPCHVPARILKVAEKDPIVPAKTINEVKTSQELGLNDNNFIVKLKGS